MPRAHRKATARPSADKVHAKTWTFIEGPAAADVTRMAATTSPQYIRGVGTMIGTITAAVERVVDEEYLHGKPADDGLEVPNQAASYLTHGFDFRDCAIERFPTHHFKEVQRSADQRARRLLGEREDKDAAAVDAALQRVFVEALSPAVRARVDAVLRPELAAIVPPPAERAISREPVYESHFRRRFGGVIVSELHCGRGIIRVDPVDNILLAGAPVDDDTAPAARYIAFHTGFGGATHAREGQRVSFRVERYYATPTPSPPASERSDAESDDAASMFCDSQNIIKESGDAVVVAQVPWSQHKRARGGLLGDVGGGGSKARMWTVGPAGDGHQPGSPRSLVSSRLDGLDLWSAINSSGGEDDGSNAGGHRNDDGEDPFGEFTETFYPSRKNLDGTRSDCESRTNAESNVSSPRRTHSRSGAPATRSRPVPTPPEVPVADAQSSGSSSQDAHPQQPAAGGAFGIAGSAEAQTLDTVLEREVQTLTRYLTNRKLDPFLLQNKETLQVEGVPEATTPLLVGSAVDDMVESIARKESVKNTKELWGGGGPLGFDDAVSLAEDSVLEMSQMDLQPPLERPVVELEGLVVDPAGNDRYQLQQQQPADDGPPKPRQPSMYSAEWYDRIISEDIDHAYGNVAASPQVTAAMRIRSLAAARRLTQNSMQGLAKRKRSTAWNMSATRRLGSIVRHASGVWSTNGSIPSDAEGGVGEGSLSLLRSMRSARGGTSWGKQRVAHGGRGKKRNFGGGARQPSDFYAATPLRGGCGTSTFMASSLSGRGPSGVAGSASSAGHSFQAPRPAATSCPRIHTGAITLKQLPSVPSTSPRTAPEAPRGEIDDREGKSPSAREPLHIPAIPSTTSVHVRGGLHHHSYRGPRGADRPRPSPPADIPALTSATFGPSFQSLTLDNTVPDITSPFSQATNVTSIPSSSMLGGYAAGGVLDVRHPAALGLPRLGDTAATVGGGAGGGGGSNTDAPAPTPARRKVVRYRAVDLVAEEILPYTRAAKHSDDDETSESDEDDLTMGTPRRVRSVFRTSLAAAPLDTRRPSFSASRRGSVRRTAQTGLPGRQRRRRTSLHTGEGLQFFVDNVQPNLVGERYRSRSSVGTVLTDGAPGPQALPPLSLYDLIVARLTMPDDERQDLLAQLQYYSLERTGMASVGRDKQKSAAVRQAEKDRQEVEQRLQFMYPERHPLRVCRTPDVARLPRCLQRAVDEECVRLPGVGLDGEPVRSGETDDEGDPPSLSFEEVIQLFKRKGLNRSELQGLLWDHQQRMNATDSDDEEYGVLRDLDSKAQRTVRPPEDLTRRPRWGTRQSHSHSQHGADDASVSLRADTDASPPETLPTAPAAAPSPPKTAARGRPGAAFRL